MEGQQLLTAEGLDRGFGAPASRPQRQDLSHLVLGGGGSTSRTSRSRSRCRTTSRGSGSRATSSAWSVTRPDTSAASTSSATSRAAEKARAADGGHRTARVEGLNEKYSFDSFVIGSSIVSLTQPRLLHRPRRRLRRTTRCSSTGAPGSARRTSSRRSATTSGSTRATSRSVM